MMDEKHVTGRCLCGAIRYRLEGEPIVFQYCHCSRCRKVSGSAHSANIMIRPEQLSWLQGEEFLQSYIPENTRHFATSFCKQCGASMPWLAKTGQAMVVPAGSLDEDPGYKPVQNIFWDSKSDWYQPVSELPCYATLPGKSDD